MEYMTPSRSAYLYPSRLLQDKENSGGCHIISPVVCFLWRLRKSPMKVLGAQNHNEFGDFTTLPPSHLLFKTIKTPSS